VGAKEKKRFLLEFVENMVESQTVLGFAVNLA